MISAWRLGCSGLAIALLATACKDDPDEGTAATETTAFGTETAGEADTIGLDDGDDGDDQPPLDTTTGDDTPDTTAGGDDAPVAGPTLDDDFDDDLSDWEILNPSQATVTVQGGELSLEPAPNSLWFEGTSAVQVYKLVSGDFAMTGHVRARSISAPGSPPVPQFRLGGLMARNPSTANGENYVFIVVGADADDVSVETKTTTNSVSTFEGPAWPGAEGELRVCRVGSTFELLIREPGGSWESHATFARPDLPDELQLGPIAYAFQSEPDLRVSVDYVRFTEVTDIEQCRQ